ncbi:hypothetical protein GOP47_0023235 [Adiantum capillus-veneris]|uniref:Pentatricopeptide repeat-containing protein n=1 Tax=Adiantum capillus-veneris TaxID=13818 RepID=A0A9D4Z7N3_ADICA|nr:hypothetical protein GOP47_0023235 [Adiantum capillus-veneris]
MALLMKTRKDLTNVGGALELIPSSCDARVSLDLKAGNEESNIRALSKALRLGGALFLLSKLDDRGIRKRVEDYASILHCCVRVKDLETGKVVHSFIIESEREPSLVLFNALVDMYCKCGSVVDARSLFESMHKKDVFTWTTMIAGYAILGPPEKSLDLFWNMEKKNVRPDKVTFLSIIKACAKLKLLEHGKRVHASLKQSGIDQNLLLKSSLVDMYAKCGSIDFALQEFKEMPRRDCVSWNAMISGYAQNGCFEDALYFFLKMMKEGFEPDKITFANVLKACAKLQMLNHGMWAHNFLVKQKLEADIFVGSTLVDMYAKCGSIDDAWKVFNTMPRKTEVSWNAMIIGYAQPGYAEKSLALFWKMELANVTPTAISYVGAFKACAVLGTLEEAKSVHRKFANSKIIANLILKNALVDMYAKCGDLTEARQAFDNIQEKDIVSWNALIAGYAEHGPKEEAIHLYDKMRKGLQPDRVTFLSVLKACTSLPSLEQGILVHSHIRCSHLGSDVFVASTLVDMYAKCGSLEEACKVFDGMQEKNEVAWNAMIAGYVQHGHLDRAFKLFQKMDQTRTKPVKITYLSMIKACSSLGNTEKGKLIHAFLAFSGYEADKFIQNSLVDMYSKCGEVDDAQHIFDELEEKNLVSWNALISGFVQQGRIETAFDLFEEMEKTRIEPNEVTFLTAIRACASLAHLNHGMRIHSCIVQGGYESFPYVENSLIDMYSKCRSVEDARHLFDLLSKEDLVTWNVMIAGYTSSGLDEEAFKLFQQMGSQGLQPDEVTLLSLLKASGSLGSLKHGKEVHALIKRNGLQSNVVGNALIDMYAKCGSCDDACDVFKSLSLREVVSWNAVISGYLQHGHAKEALNLFQEMKEDCHVPDRITFLNVLKACGTLGYLDQAKQIHKSAENFCVEFDLFLNNTLIDMYAKCGDVDAARQIFDDMHERDSISWNALMTGYAQHGHVEETIECLHKMQVEQKLDHVTFVATLSMCNYAGLVNEGFYHFDSLYSEHGISHTQEHCACMVDILCRAGRILEAAEFIRKMPFIPGPIVWMALLSGCRLGSSLFLAINAAKSILELQPQNTAPYVVLSNLCALVGDRQGANNLELVMKLKDVNTLDNNSSVCIGDQGKDFSLEATSCTLESIHSQLRTLFFTLNGLS